MSAGRGDAGFTLIEVLVAFVIAALAVGVVLQGSGAGLRAAEVAGRTEEAVSRAKSHLAVIGRAAPLVAGEQSGDDGGGYRWRTRVQMIGDAPLGADPANGPSPEPSAPRSRLALYAVAVAISWVDNGQTRQVELDSRRVATLAGDR